MKTIHAEALFGTRAKIAVLRVLARVQVPLSIRQVAVQAGMSHAVVADALDSLVDLGVLMAAEAGRSRVHWLERRSVIVREMVLPLFGAEENLGEGLVRELRSSMPDSVFSAVLFGSRARGENRLDSDYDVLVVEPDRTTLDVTLADLERLRGELRARLGASVSVVGYTIDEVRDLVWRGDNFMDGVLREGVLLVGVAPRGWVHAGEGA